MMASENDERTALSGAESKAWVKKLVAGLSIAAVFIVGTVALAHSSITTSQAETDELNSQNVLSNEGTDDYYYPVYETKGQDDDYESEESDEYSLATKGVKGVTSSNDVVVQGKGKKGKGKKKKGKKYGKGKGGYYEEEYNMDDVNPITPSEVRYLFTRWNEALQTGDSDIVAQRYASNAVLLPTVSDRVRTDYFAIKDYFDTFLAKDPYGVILESHIDIGSDWARDGGIYEFTMSDGSVVRARYSFLYVWENGDWMISQHHSSMMPEPLIPQSITETEVRGLFDRWNAALQTEDPDTVAKLYADGAVLLPTLSNQPRDTHELIEDYFVHFLAKKPEGEIMEGWIMIGDNWAEDVGTYAFTFEDGSVAEGRYSFVYTYVNGEWMILHHHSSLMPEPVGDAVIDEAGVANLFTRWNDALQTGDPDTVAQRYASNAVLLPTVSDRVRTDYEGIKDYFVKFLAGEPFGVILESHIEIGAGWARDGGIYEFTMAVDGSVVRARYSYLYVYEGGDWMISQHHSSMMPEPLIPQPITESEVRALFDVWNNALQTEDPDTVANLYAENAVLLPTLSNQPRDTHELIEDYFVSFLAKKPFGQILEGWIMIGDNWAEDVGTYSFTFEDNSVAVARYSFVYTYVHGEWMILHHHSSLMPEPIE